MACNITSAEIDPSTAQVTVGAGVVNLMRIFGSALSPSTVQVKLSSTGFAFSNITVDQDLSTNSFLLVNFLCDVSGAALDFSGDIQVNLTNPDCTGTCHDVDFVPAVPMPPATRPSRP